MNRINDRQQGFTLIELIVVIVILGILAVTAAPKFMNLTLCRLALFRYEVLKTGKKSFRRCAHCGHAGLREEPSEPEWFGR